MANDAQTILGKWTVKVKAWTWEYSFKPDGKVTWRDPLNSESGAGRWSLSPKFINISWSDSSTKESLSLPITALKQTGWYDANYYKGPYEMRKAIAPSEATVEGSYTGEESAIDLPDSAPPDDAAVCGMADRIPKNTKPIYDDASGAVIGYMYSSGGYYAFYDVTGQFVGSDEIGLEEPLIDPIDFIMLVGGLARGVGRTVIKMGIRAAASAGTKVVIRGLTTAVIGTLRTAFRAALSVRTLKFTATTVSRMTTKGRYIPVHILKMAIRYGAREADPQGVKGAFQYTMKIIRSEANIAPGLTPGASWAGRTYTLKVVVKEELTSSTVLHFHIQ